LAIDYQVFKPVFINSFVYICDVIKKNKIMKNVFPQPQTDFQLQLRKEEKNNFVFIFKIKVLYREFFTPFLNSYKF
jgi:hypothetical protein